MMTRTQFLKYYSANTFSFNNNALPKTVEICQNRQNGPRAICIFFHKKIVNLLNHKMFDYLIRT